MKGLGIVAALLLSSMIAPTASAQERPAGLARADLFGSLGWFNADTRDLTPYDDWYNRSLFGGGTAGWYWTDHLKTEIDAGATTRARLFSGQPVVINGVQTFRSSELTFSTRRLAISQQYQFGDNAWFHPHLAAGVDLTAERIERRDEAVTIFGQGAGGPRVLEPAVQHPPRTEWHTRPFVAGGFKAYMTRRAFFRSDMRLVLGSGVDEVLVRVGFGVDF